jgi:hypothetical protein
METKLYNGIKRDISIKYGLLKKLNKGCLNSNLNLINRCVLLSKMEMLMMGVFWKFLIMKIRQCIGNSKERNRECLSKNFIKKYSFYIKYLILIFLEKQTYLVGTLEFIYPHEPNMRRKFFHQKRKRLINKSN